MKTRMMAATAAVLSILSAGAAAQFFDNPVQRPHTCQVIMTWDAAAPDTVYVETPYPVGTIGPCIRTQALAGAIGTTVLVRQVTVTP